MAGDDTIYWHGNSNLLNGIDDFVKSFGTFEESRYADLPFVIYYAYGEIYITSTMTGVITTDEVDMAADSYITMYDLSSEQRVYRRIPDEYIPDTIARTGDVGEIARETAKENHYTKAEIDAKLSALDDALAEAVGELDNGEVQA